VFERFSERARQVVVLAQDEARSLGHDRIGSAHLLLGLLREDYELAELIADAADARARLVELVGLGDAGEGLLPFTDDARAVFAAAGRDAEGPIGPIQLALALVELPGEATVLRLLRVLGVDAGALHDELAAPGGEADPLGLDQVARRVLDTAARHADDGQPGPEHLLLALVLEAPELTRRTLGVDDGLVVHERLVRLLEGPEPGALAPRRDIAVIEAALQTAACAERSVTAEDLLLGLIEIAPDVVARAAIDLEAIAARLRRPA
jgi:hypothetical protein